MLIFYVALRNTQNFKSPEGLKTNKKHTNRKNQHHQTKWSKVKAAKKISVFILSDFSIYPGWVVAMEIDTRIKSRQTEGGTPPANKLK